MDDSPMQALQAQSALAPLYEVEPLPDGSAALERISSGEAPDVLILDWVMPVVSGVEVCKFLGALPDVRRRLRILLLTSQRDPAQIAEGLAAGADDFLAKPCDSIELRARVAALVRAQELHERERRALEEARRATRLRDELLAVVAHDLRSPLMVVSLTARLLGKVVAAPGIPARLQTLTRRIEAACGTAVRLVHDLVDMASLETGTMRVAARPTGAESMVLHAVEALNVIAAEKGVQLRSRESGPDVLVLADAHRVEQLFASLIGNAVKFTPAGAHVTVGFTVAPGYVQFDVEDEGPGIGESEQARLFDRGWRGHSPSESGLGLGLFIARGIVAAHGGRIRVESKPGAGACFSFTLPRVPATP